MLVSKNKDSRDEVHADMADVIPFPCVRPQQGLVEEVAALPYDVYNLAEGRAEIEKHPKSFLCIDMAEAMLPDSTAEHADIVYETARALLDKRIADGTYLCDDEACYYLYRLIAPNGHSQTGVMGCASIDDYTENIIKRHEKTKPNKETDRIKHVDTCSAHTGPVFLAFRSDGSIEEVMEKAARTEPLYDFTADDGVRHTIWRVSDAADTETVRRAFEATPALYLADGHHRAASAVHVGKMRREAAETGGDALYEADALGRPMLASDHFLTLIFPSDQLAIYDYNRVVSDLNGLTAEEFLGLVGERFEISEPQAQPVKPEGKGVFGMFLKGSWYRLCIKQPPVTDDPVEGLDVSLLQDRLLAPILGIDDPRTSKRIDFVGGIRGLEGLERRVADDMEVAFALYPTSIDELLAVADAGMLMPPKSTWFEPKPRSGIFIHRI